MSVAKQSFSFKASGVNYDLTIDDNPKLSNYLWYICAVVSGLIVVASLVFNFINYKIAAF